MKEWSLWFEKRLDNAIEAAEVESQLENGSSTKNFIRLLVCSSQIFKNDCDLTLNSFTCP